MCQERTKPWGAGTPHRNGRRTVSPGSHKLSGAQAGERPLAREGKVSSARPRNFSWKYEALARSARLGDAAKNLPLERQKLSRKERALGLLGHKKRAPTSFSWKPQASTRKWKSAGAKGNGVKPKARSRQAGRQACEAEEPPRTVSGSRELSARKSARALEQLPLATRTQKKSKRFFLLRYTRTAPI